MKKQLVLSLAALAFAFALGNGFAVPTTFTDGIFAKPAFAKSDKAEKGKDGNKGGKSSDNKQKNKGKDENSAGGQSDEKKGVGGGEGQGAEKGKHKGWDKDKKEKKEKKGKKDKKDK